MRFCLFVLHPNSKRIRTLKLSRFNTDSNHYVRIKISASVCTVEKRMVTKSRRVHRYGYNNLHYSSTVDARVFIVI